MNLLEAKIEVKRIQKETGIGRAKALHLVAQQLGFKSWTALLANTNINMIYNEYKRDLK